jgi:hypothetical protein
MTTGLICVHLIWWTAIVIIGYMIYQGNVVRIKNETEREIHNKNKETEMIDYYTSRDYEKRTIKGCSESVWQKKK